MGMKKVIRSGLMVLALMCLLGISAFAASNVTETGTSNWSYSATLDGSDSSTATTVKTGDMYVLVVIKASALPSGGGFPSALTADSIIYIDQKTAVSTDEATNSITFSGFIPMNYSGGKAFVAGGSLTVPVALGTVTSHGVLGDANGDMSVNVADITAIRDHILERTLLTGSNLTTADVNGDGSINVADITKLRDFILERITSLS